MKPPVKTKKFKITLDMVSFIERERKKKNPLSLRELADQLGVKKDAVARIARDPAGARRYRKLAALGKAPKQLCGTVRCSVCRQLIDLKLSKRCVRCHAEGRPTTLLIPFKQRVPKPNVDAYCDEPGPHFTYLTPTRAGA